MITLLELQNLLCKKEFNPYINIENQDKVLLHLVEEIGELVKSYRKNGIYSQQFNEELGDCQILLLFFAISTHTNLQGVTIDKIRDNISKGKFQPNEVALEGLKAIFG